MVQLLAQQPDLVMLDEPDSGVDLENIKLIGEAINRLTQKDLRPSYRTKSGIIITHSAYSGVYESRSGSRYARRINRLQRKPE